MIGFSGSYDVRRIAKWRSAAAGFLVASLASIVSPVLSGCALQQTADLPVDMAAGAHGKLMGGQQPISDASIYLVQTGTTGYGTANSTSLLASTTSDANGGFTLPAFTCPAPSNMTLIEARGGNPGLAAGTNNSAIFEMAFLGPCNGITTSTFINITEVTTVAAAYTMRPFASGNNVGTSAGNYIGLENAMATYNNLVNNTTGQVPGANVPTGAAIPVATINSLANTISACVNTTDPTSTACSSLFTATGVPSTGLTANTFNIAVAIASAPTTNVSTIFNVGTSSPPFLPALTSAPSDWTVGINYTSGNLNSPQLAMDIDAAGNVWVSTVAGFAGTVELLFNAGSLGATGLLNGTVDNPAGLAIDQSDNVVVTSSTVGDASVIKYSPLTKDIVFKATTSSPFVSPTGVTIDLDNDIVVADPGGEELYFLSTTDGSRLGGAYIGFPFAYPAVSEAGNLWIADSNPGLVEEFFGYGVNSGLNGTYFPDGLEGTGGRFAFDSNMITYLVRSDSSRAAITFFPFTPPNPAPLAEERELPYTGEAVAVDGLNQIWVGMAGGASRVNVYGQNFAAAIGGIVPNPSNSPLPVAEISIDGSGNVWLANGSSGGLFEIVGAAAPVVTPRSVAAKMGKQGEEP